MLVCWPTISVRIVTYVHSWLLCCRLPAINSHRRPDLVEAHGKSLASTRQYFADSSEYYLLVLNLACGTRRIYVYAWTCFPAKNYAAHVMVLDISLKWRQPLNLNRHHVYYH